ncbi:MAG: alpha/beta fold hydrolase [Pseudomonadota bacterium]
MNSNIDATKTVPPPSVASPAWPRARHLPLGGLHRMAWRAVGAPEGEPWLLLHGGPGSSCQPGMLRPFDLSRQRVVAPDQRGCGASLPKGRTAGNHTAALVADMEALREYLGLERWSVLAGSWGTVVALAYTLAHPQRVQRLVLRGAFALSGREVGGLLLPSSRVRRSLGWGALWPIVCGTVLPVALQRLTQLIQSGTPGVASLRAARGWGLLETASAARSQRRSLLHAALGKPRLAASIRREWASLRKAERRAIARLKRPGKTRADRNALGKFRIQAHYLRHRGFMRSGQLDRGVLQAARHGLPVDWVHGRFDAICPPANSRRWAALGRAAGGAVVHAEPHSGHLGHEPDMLSALRKSVRRTLA